MDEIQFWRDFDEANRPRNKGRPDPGSIGLMVAIPYEGEPLLYAYCDTSEDEGRIEDTVFLYVLRREPLPASAVPDPVHPVDPGIKRLPEHAQDRA